MTAALRTIHQPLRQAARVGIGTGGNPRLVDPGAARALAAAAEELGYASVWTFDSPASERWTDDALGHAEPDVISTIEAMTAASIEVRVGAALLRTAWPLSTECGARLRRANELSAGRLVIARPYSTSTDRGGLERTLQMWAPDLGRPARWADGWMVERWEQDWPDPGSLAGACELVVRLPVGDCVEQIAADMSDLRASGASEIVLDVIEDAGVDRALDLYSRIAERVEAQLEPRTARQWGETR